MRDKDQLASTFHFAKARKQNSVGWGLSQLQSRRPERGRVLEGRWLGRGSRPPPGWELFLAVFSVFFFFFLIVFFSPQA